jgi:TonB-dependent SusC/RagA subfamily outer membrane receptor
VTSENGQPLSDVSVELRALGLGSLSRADGRYTITIPSARQAGGSTVSVSVRRLGYRTQSRTVTLPASGALTADFVLAANPLQLGEIVVTGAGTTTAAERVGVIRKPVDSTLIRRSNETNLVTALAGKAAGVTVQQQSGEAGGGARIQIRGVRSVTGTGQPLFIIDGQVVTNATNITNGNVSSTSSPNRLSDINPNDIESLEVLSGPSAAAIYGSQAGNGVVLITTKKGRAGRTTYSLLSNVSTTARVSTLGRIQSASGGHRDRPLPLAWPAGRPTAFPFVGLLPQWRARRGRHATFNKVSRDLPSRLPADNTLNVVVAHERTTFILSGGVVTPERLLRHRQRQVQPVHGAAERVAPRRRPAGAGGNVLYARTGLNGFGRGNNTNGMLLPALRTPPDFNNRNYVTETGLHRSFGSRTRPLGRSGATAGSTTRST